MQVYTFCLFIVLAASAMTSIVDVKRDISTGSNLPGTQNKSQFGPYDYPNAFPDPKKLPNLRTPASTEGNCTFNIVFENVSNVVLVFDFIVLMSTMSSLKSEQVHWLELPLQDTGDPL